MFIHSHDLRAAPGASALGRPDLACGAEQVKALRLLEKKTQVLEMGNCAQEAHLQVNLGGPGQPGSGHQFCDMPSPLFDQRKKQKHREVK